MEDVLCANMIFCILTMVHFLWSERRQWGHRQASGGEARRGQSVLFLPSLWVMIDHNCRHTATPRKGFSFRLSRAPPSVTSLLILLCPALFVDLCLCLCVLYLSGQKQHGPAREKHTSAPTQTHWGGVETVKLGCVLVHMCKWLHICSGCRLMLLVFCAGNEEDIVIQQGKTERTWGESGTVLCCHWIWR